jgi:choline dehydrogenase
VADASVMPAMVRANINLTVIMIGERLAELLRNS